MNASHAVACLMQTEMIAVFIVPLALLSVPQFSRAVTSGRTCLNASLLKQKYESFSKATKRIPLDSTAFLLESEKEIWGNPSA